MAESDRDRWRDDHDRQERERIAQIRHAYGPEDHSSIRRGSGRYSTGDNEPSADDSHARRGRDMGQRGARDWQRDGIGAEGFGQAFAGNGGRGFGGGDDYRYRGNARGGTRGSAPFDRASKEAPSRFGDHGADHRAEANHRGRGPKGYRRSDERIKEDVSDRLTDDRYLDASDIEVAVEGGEVTLGGGVDDRQARRRAEDIAEQVSGVTYVQNRLRVKGRPGSDHGTKSAAASFEEGRLAGSGQVPGPSTEASTNRSANNQLPL